MWGGAMVRTCRLEMLLLVMMFVLRRGTRLGHIHLLRATNRPRGTLFLEEW